MGKRPAFLLYSGDWLRDLEEHPLEIEGAWIRICCKITWPTRPEEKPGEATKTLLQWSKILKLSCKKTFKIILYLQTNDIATVIPSAIKFDQNEQITITSRRLVRDEKQREKERDKKRTQRQMSPNCPEDVPKMSPNCPSPSSSSSSSSSSNTKTKEKTIKKESLILPDWINQELWDELLAHRKKRKAPNSDRALKAIIKNISELMQEGHKPDDLLEKILQRGWLTIEKSWLQTDHQQADDSGIDMAGYHRRKAEQALL